MYSSVNKRSCLSENVQLLNLKRNFAKFVVYLKFSCTFDMCISSLQSHFFYIEFLISNNIYTFTVNRSTFSKVEESNDHSHIFSHEMFLLTETFTQQKHMKVYQWAHKRACCQGSVMKIMIAAVSTVCNQGVVGDPAMKRAGGNGLKAFVPYRV